MCSKSFLLVSAILIVQFLSCPAQENQVEAKTDQVEAKTDQDEGEAAPDSCTYTFQVSGPQLARYCASVPSSNHHQVALLSQKVNALVENNAKLQADMAALKKKCDGNSEGIKNIVQETEAWRQIIRWPQSKDNINPGNLSNILDRETEYTDCWHAYKSGNTKKGIYKLKPKNAIDTFMAFCEEGWTVIQRRFNGKTSFNKNWDEYSMGFGDLSGEFWLGNDRIHDLTSQGDTQLRFEGVTWSGKKYRSIYQDFKVGNEISDYEFSVGNMTSGNYRDVLSNLNGMKFSTPDRDNDEWYNGNCARHYRAGWWLKSCGWSPNHEHCRGYTCMSWGERRLEKTQLKVRAAEAV